MASMTEILECPVCFDPLAYPIRQCRKGHSICECCARRVNECPLCKAPITDARNFHLEKVIANLSGMQLAQASPCKYQWKGCRVQLKNLVDLKEHELECKKRDYMCEGKLFGNWQCDWTGNYDNIVQHYRSSHANNAWMNFRTSAYMKVDFTRDYSDIQLIPYKNGAELFWYKHRMDPWRENAYWAIQFIGPKAEANKYVYEFGIKYGFVRAMTTREICTNDSINANDVFQNGNCVTVPYRTLKNHLNEDNEVGFSFKIGEIIEKTVARDLPNRKPSHDDQAQTAQADPLPEPPLRSQTASAASLGMPPDNAFNNFQQRSGIPFGYFNPAQNIRPHMAYNHNFQFSNPSAQRAPEWYQPPYRNK